MTSSNTEIDSMKSQDSSPPCKKTLVDDDESIVNAKNKISKLEEALKILESEHDTLLSEISAVKAEKDKIKKEMIQKQKELKKSVRREC